MLSGKYRKDRFDMKEEPCPVKEVCHHYPDCPLDCPWLYEEEQQEEEVLI